MAAAFAFNLIHYSTELNDSLRLMKQTVAAQSFLTSRLFSHSITPHLFIYYSSHNLLPPPCTTTAAAAAPLWGLSCGFQNQMPDTMVTLTQVIRSPVPLLFIDSWNILDTRCLQVKTCAGVSSVKERRKCFSKNTINIDKDPASSPWRAGHHVCLRRLYCFITDAIRLNV